MMAREQVLEYQRSHVNKDDGGDLHNRIMNL